ncbi:MAG: 4-(cytidine 5'-diphospho)-2-C-methyl-D-erythritol kinase [Fimbriimonadaceae bacterium]
MRAIRILSPAKVNLSLAVGPPLRNGYHPIRSIFQAISLYDEIVAEPADRESVEVEGMALEPGSTTLEKTLRLMREVVEVPKLRWKLIKRIPAQSGLGGGSSNAAAVIHAFRWLGVAGADSPATHEVARAVGCDVPFFLTGGRCLVQGLGEQVEPLPGSGPEWFVVAQPGARVSTVEAYRRLDDSGALEALPDYDTLFRNDFEAVAPAECLALRDQLIQLGGVGACLTGSGSAVTGVFDSEHSASAAAKALEAEFVCVARALPPTGFQIEEIAPGS